MKVMELIDKLKYFRSQGFDDVAFSLDPECKKVVNGANVHTGGLYVIIRPLFHSSLDVTHLAQNYTPDEWKEIHKQLTKEMEEVEAKLKEINEGTTE